MGARRLYSFATPYNADQLGGVAFTQTANVAYFAHIDRPVQRLTRNDHTDWSFAEVAFGPTLTAPTGVTASPTTPEAGGAISYAYVVTAINDDTGQESRASDAAATTNDLTLEGNFNTISWTAVDGAERYAIYKGNNGAFGFIGGTEGTSFQDGTPVIVADLSDSPPKGQNPFDGEGNYPSTLAFHQQRLLFGRTRNAPNAVYGSQTADFENMDYARPAKPDDAFSFALVGKKVNAVSQLVSSTSLLALTTDSIMSIAGADGNAIGVGTPVMKRESGRGASRLPAVEVDDIVFFQPNQGSSVRALGFTFESDGYRSNDVTIFSPHLFENDEIVAWAYQTEPNSCVWCAMSSGLLLCFTWEREQDVWGWTVCETEGKVEDVTVITEGGLDRVYVIVKRTIAGREVRSYERMAAPHGGDYSAACHLDCSVTQVYDPPRAVVDGLWHLEGAVVSAFYDGYVATGLSVAGGQVTLPFAATIVTVGLPYTAEIVTLPMTLQSQAGSEHVSRQTIGKVVMRALDTKGAEVSVNGAPFEQVAERQSEFMGVLPDIGERDYDLSLTSSWNDGATLTIRQEQPLPMHVTGLFVKPEVGDD